MKIGIIDYGAGNIQSVKNALNKLGQDCIVSMDKKVLDSVDKIILPGVGNAGKAMENILKYELDSYLKSTNKPLLGICLGMQLLCTFSEENNTSCIGIIDGSLKRFEPTEKVPKMGWNKIDFESSDLFIDIAKDSYFYFVHSYYLPLCDHTIATADYGLKYSSVIHKNHFFGVQFHPEKSGKAGLQLIQNFINL